MKTRFVAVVAALRKARRAIVAALVFPVMYWSRKWFAVELDEETVRVLTDAALSYGIYKLIPAAEKVEAELPEDVEG